MSEKRILIPLKELKPGNIRLCRMADDKEMYNAIENYLTRSITPDDIRSCFRRANQWTDKENAELSDVIIHYGANLVADKVLDIALRPAPEPDPWELMDKMINHALTHEEDPIDINDIADIFDRLKATRKEDE